MPKLLFKKDGVLVFANGDMYKQIGIDDIIAKGALHSTGNGSYNSLLHESSIGKTPGHFSPYGGRLFFNPMSAAEKKEFKKKFNKETEEQRRKRLMKHFRD